MPLRRTSSAVRTGLAIIPITAPDFARPDCAPAPASGPFDEWFVESRNRLELARLLCPEIVRTGVVACGGCPRAYALQQDDGRNLDSPLDVSVRLAAPFAGVHVRIGLGD